jgi:hypothetical protein
MRIEGEGKGKLTSLEGVLEWESIVDFEAFLGSTGKATLVLVEPDIKDFFLIGYHISPFIIIINY